MRFSYEELLCFNSITQGPAPFGIKLKHFPGEREEVVARTQRQLKEKMILDEGAHLTKAGGVIVRCYELYRNSHIHVILNEMKIALLANGECIVMYPAEDGYEMISTDHARLMAAVLQECPYIRKEEAREKGKWKGYGYDEFSAYIEENAKGSLMIGEYEGMKAVRERVFYWTEEAGYIYNLQRERQKEAAPREMRIELLKALKLWERQEEIRQAAVAGQV